MLCYQGFLLKKFKDLQPLAPGKVSCTKKCHQKAIKEASGGGDDVEGGGRKGNWDCDGKNGPDDPKTSVKILIDWWTTEGNYSKFCGKNNNGIKKSQFCAQLAQKMSNETLTNRDGKNVLSKIQHIERTFKEAHTFATSETGAGIEENDKTTFKDAVKKKCPYYYELLEVMCDRASSKPKATTYDLSSEGEDDNMSDISEADKSTTTKRSAFTEGTSSTKKSRRPAKKSTAVVDEETIAALNQASQNSAAKMAEMKRHHQFLEKIEERKQAIEEKRLELEQSKETTNSWKGKYSELEYKMQLLQRYEELKDRGWSDERIMAFYPDMKQIVDTTNTFN